MAHVEWQEVGAYTPPPKAPPGGQAMLAVVAVRVQAPQACSQLKLPASRRVPHGHVDPFSFVVVQVLNIEDRTFKGVRVAGSRAAWG